MARHYNSSGPIFIGVLIALGAEQLVQWVHGREDVAQPDVRTLVNATDPNELCKPLTE